VAKFGITNYFKGGTKEQYDNTVKAVHPDGGKSLPAGQSYHAAGPTADGFQVIAIWDSRASWETFRDETLLPTFANAENVLPGPPEITEFDVHNEMTL
jgi:hypothetical protein